MHRDFTKSNIEYFKKNKIAIIVLSVFLIVGILIGSIFGFKENFEFAGYSEFTVKVGSEADNNAIIKNITQIVNDYGGDFDTASIYDVGDNTRIVIRYSNQLNEDKQNEVTTAIITKLNIEESAVSEHVNVSPIVSTKDYVYTACAILILIVLVSIFAYFRYNGASALSIIISSIIGTLSFLSIGAILRLTIGASYFAMIVALNVLIMYSNIAIFEEIKSTNWLSNSDYASAINHGVKNSKFKLCALNIAVLIMGLLFVLFAPSALKYVSLNIMFIAVVALAVALYVVPFVWSVFITHCKKPKLSVKVSGEKDSSVDNNQLDK